MHCSHHRSSLNLSKLLQEGKIPEEGAVTPSPRNKRLSLGTTEKGDGKPYQYKGRIAFGRPSGYGKFDYKNDDMYVGDFQNGLFHGYGTYAAANKVGHMSMSACLI